ncbi:MAG: hypothetical protein V8T01_10870, partial [Oscillospiraceae bacterium]
CRVVHYRMGLENDPRMMGAKIATNVASERSPVLRVMPLFIKNAAMRVVFDMVGEIEILPVPVQPRARGAAGGDGPVCRADGLYHRRPGEGAL